MSKSTYPLKPNSVKEAAAELAKIDGVSLNQFIAAPPGHHRLRSMNGHSGRDLRLVWIAPQFSTQQYATYPRF